MPAPSRELLDPPVLFHTRVIGLADQGLGPTGEAGAPEPSSEAPTVFLDLDTVLLAIHQERRGLELGLQPDLEEAIARLSEAGGRIVVLVDPPPAENQHGLETSRRLDVVRQGLGPTADNLLIVACPHGEERTCTCAKPESGLIEVALEQHDLARRGGWYIGADQEGVMAGRSAGLHTIRIGPAGENHLSAVHRPDYEARDLLDAANHILLETLD